MKTDVPMQRVPLARRAARLVPNMPAAEPHDVISFGSGHGCPAVFPDLTEAAKSALNTHRPETLQYGPTLGLPAMREWIARHVCENGARDIGPDNVLVVNGAKNGLGLIGRLLLEEGLHHERLEEPPEHLRVDSEGALVREVVDAVERHRRGDARVGILEAGKRHGL